MDRLSLACHALTLLVAVAGTAVRFGFFAGSALAVVSAVGFAGHAMMFSMLHEWRALASREPTEPWDRARDLDRIEAAELADMEES